MCRNGKGKAVGLGKGSVERFAPEPSQQWRSQQQPGQEQQLQPVPRQQRVADLIYVLKGLQRHSKDPQIMELMALIEQELADIRRGITKEAFVFHDGEVRLVVSRAEVPALPLSEGSKRMQIATEVQLDMELTGELEQKLVAIDCGIICGAAVSDDRDVQLEIVQNFGAFNFDTMEGADVLVLDNGDDQLEAVKKFVAILGGTLEGAVVLDDGDLRLDMEPKRKLGQESVAIDCGIMRGAIVFDGRGVQSEVEQKLVAIDCGTIEGADVFALTEGSRCRQFAMDDDELDAHTDEYFGILPSCPGG